VIVLALDAFSNVGLFLFMLDVAMPTALVLLVAISSFPFVSSSGDAGCSRLFWVGEYDG
jgi:hypothetical protein